MGKNATHWAIRDCAAQILQRLHEGCFLSPLNYGYKITLKAYNLLVFEGLLTKMKMGKNSYYSITIKGKHHIQMNGYRIYGKGKTPD